MIIQEFYEIRLEYYHKSYDYLIEKYTYELKIIESKIKFIEGIINDQIIIFEKDDDEVNKILEDNNLIKISKVAFEDKNEEDVKTFDYLLNMPMRTMTKKKLDELNKQLLEKGILLEELMNKNPKSLWKEDLEQLKKNL